MRPFYPDPSVTLELYAIAIVSWISAGVMVLLQRWWR